MGGLLLKDFYMLKDNLLITIVVLLAIGLILSHITSPYVLIILGGIQFSILALSSINLDKTYKWNKLSITMPVSRRDIVLSKYIMYFLLSIAGVALGIVLTAILTYFNDGFDTSLFQLYWVLSAIYTLGSGSFSIPTSFFFSEEKSIIAMITSYVACGAILAGIVVFFKPSLSTITSFKLLGAGIVIFTFALFIISFIVTTKIYSKLDI